MRLRPPLLLLAGSTVAAAVIAAPGVASAAPAAAKGPTVTVLNRTVIAPYHLAHSTSSVYVADGGTSTVSKLTSKGLVAVAHGPQGPAGEVAGVAINGKGTLAYTASDFAANVHTLTIKPKYGKTRTVDLGTFEATRNPDKFIRYGIDNPTQCQRDALDAAGVPVSYRGLVDSHPYAVSALPNDAWVVADAGGNDLLKVDKHGRISVISVLPRQPATITADAAAGLGLPDCVVGVVYNFEAVPTDVHLASNGRYIASLLPGGPEDPSLGARGKVYRINSHNGHWKVVGRHLAGATGVAVSAKGRVFAAELFGNRISTFTNGHRVTVTDLDQPAAVEWKHGHLWATSGALTPDGGAIVKIW
ncbi:MAG TPA: ScyD/ScyE family protein [Mycobacteriales bacterium]